jgi:NitT/TauT family transport system ATP-binding protein
LSGGQKQRVAIGRAWLLAPEIMLMDEPFSALDAITRENLQNTIIKLSKKRPVTWVTVTHNIEEAVFLGEEILLMSKSDGCIYERFENPNFGDVHLRENPKFYELCLRVRKAMQEVHDEA